MSILKFVMQKILLLCKTETKPKHNASTYHLPPAESHYLLLEKLKELHYRVNIFVTIGIPYLVKSRKLCMESIHEKTSKQNQRGAMAQCRFV